MGLSGPLILFSVSHVNPPFPAAPKGVTLSGDFSHALMGESDAGLPEGSKAGKMAILQGPLEAIASSKDALLGALLALLLGTRSY